MLKNVCLLEPRCIGHPPSPWLGSAVTGLGPALNARMLGSTTEQWGVGQHERFSPSVSKLVQFHKPSNHFPTIFNFWDKGLFDEFCLVKICKKCSKNQLGSPSILLRVPELEARILLRDSPPFSSPDVGENSSFLRHCIVKLWSSRWVFFRFFFLFLFCPSVSKTSVTLEPLNKSKQLPKVAQGDGRPAPAILTCRTSSSPSPKFSDLIYLTYLTCFVAFSLSLIFGKACLISITSIPSHRIALSHMLMACQEMTLSHILLTWRQKVSSFWNVSNTAKISRPRSTQWDKQLDMPGMSPSGRFDWKSWYSTTSMG